MKHLLLILALACAGMTHAQTVEEQRPPPGFKIQTDGELYRWVWINGINGREDFVCPFTEENRADCIESARRFYRVTVQPRNWQDEPSPCIIVTQYVDRVVTQECQRQHCDEPRNKWLGDGKIVTNDAGGVEK